MTGSATFTLDQLRPASDQRCSLVRPVRPVRPAPRIVRKKKTRDHQYLSFCSSFCRKCDLV